MEAREPCVVFIAAYVELTAPPAGPKPRRPDIVVWPEGACRPWIDDVLADRLYGPRPRDVNQTAAPAGTLADVARKTASRSGRR